MNEMDRVVRNVEGKLPKLVITDIDGVWTDGGMYYTADGDVMIGNNLVMKTGHGKHRDIVIPPGFQTMLQHRFRAGVGVNQYFHYALLSRYQYTRYVYSTITIIYFNHFDHAVI